MTAPSKGVRCGFKSCRACEVKLTQWVVGLTTVGQAGMVVLTTTKSLEVPRGTGLPATVRSGGHGYQSIVVRRGTRAKRSTGLTVTWLWDNCPDTFGWRTQQWMIFTVTFGLRSGSRTSTDLGVDPARAGEQRWCWCVVPMGCWCNGSTALLRRVSLSSILRWSTISKPVGRFRVTTAGLFRCPLGRCAEMVEGT